MARNNQMVRQWKLLRALGSNHFGLTLEELAEAFEVTTMTVRRDLKGLQEAGFPIFADTTDDGTKRWRVDSQVFKVPNALLTLDEALALYLSQQLLKPLAGTQVGEGIRQCIDKVQGLFKRSALDYFRRLAEVLYVHLPQMTDYSSKQMVIEVCIMAIEDERPLEICYRSGGGADRKHYRLHPYGLVFFHNSLYLIGHPPKTRDLRTFKIDRIEEAEVQEGKFDRPAGFELSELYVNSFGIFHSDKVIDVKARLQPEAANAVLEKKWHPSQKVQRHDDGSVTATWKLGDTVEFKSWILSFGHWAEVLEPKRLRQEVCKELADTIRLYGD
ncbi:MAG TPA: WYL domain-containing protein [Phycisphaerae bacterium]|nr:WYL domain-containing protein [Phycisphaerae bacterium]